MTARTRIVPASEVSSENLTAEHHLRVLSEDEVLSMLAKHKGEEDFAVLAKSHERLRNRVERVAECCEKAAWELAKAGKAVRP